MTDRDGASTSGGRYSTAVQALSPEVVAVEKEKKKKKKKKGHERMSAM